MPEALWPLPWPVPWLGRHAALHVLPWALAGLALDLAVSRYLGARRWVWQLPSSLLHELAHWLTAFFLLAKPSKISIWPGPPDKQGRRELGHVVFEARWATAGVIALAPLLVWGVAAAWLLHAPGPWVPAFFWGLWLRGMLPSSQDWAIAVRYPTVPLVLAAGLWAWWQ
jgi:hypothetical protein